MIMRHDERIGGVRDHGFKDFSWVAERFIDAALANRADLNEVLLGIEKNHTQGFAIEKAHFGTEIGRPPQDYRSLAIDAPRAARRRPSEAS